MHRCRLVAAFACPEIVSMFKVIASLRGLALCGLVPILSSAALAATFTVTNTNGTGAGSLTQAVSDANANAGADIIQFNIPGSGPFVISGLPDLSLTDTLTIDGTSQPGYSGAPLIEIRGDTDGEQIDVSASGCVISGLSFTEQFKAIVTLAPNATIRDCYFGLEPDGVTSMECYIGVEVESSYGVVGPNNVFVATTDRPLDIDNGAHHNSVIGNTFGLDASGNNSLVVPTGILISGSDNTIGGDDAASRNVINYRDYGIRIFGDRNIIKGNWIGFDKPGIHTFGFPNIGIYLQSGSNNVIGAPGASPNLIIGNNTVWVDRAFNTIIQNNWIGFNTQGVVSMNRPSDGIYIRNGSAGTQIGGSSAGARNYVGNFNNNGIHIEDSTFTTIQGNTVGLDPINGAQARNHLGIRIDRSSNLVIGGSNAGEGNLISGNVAGIVFASRPSGTDQAVIKGNYIGTDSAGTAARANSDDGITISYGPTHVTIGGAEPGAGNVISANGGFGIDIGFSFDSSSATNDVLVQGNRIGIAAIDGFPAMPNTAGGISNAFGVRNHYTQNSIAYNASAGILPKIANDPGDGDSGANNGQNFPILTKATADGTSVEIKGSLNSTANSTFTIELFQNSVDQTFGGGPGEGARYFASTSVTTDVNGDANFDVVIPSAIAAGRFITSTATDSSGNTSCFSSYASIGVPNRAPIANAGPDQTVTIPHDGNPATNTKSVSLNGSSSSDPDNDTLIYSWTEGANVVGTTAQITLNLQSGTHTFTLTVTDPSGLSGTDSVVITVNPEPNLLPNKPANGNFTFTVPHDGNPATNTVAVAATAIFSSDPDGDSLTFKWLDSGGNVVSTSSTLNATLSSGTYIYNFVVSDPYGSSSPAPQVIHVNPEPNAAPTANAGSDQTVAVPHDGNPVTNTVSVTLSGSGTDTDHDALTYSWNEGSTSIGATQSVTVSKTPGTYTFTITVTDTYGATSTDDVIVTVQPEANATPSANAGLDQNVTIPHDGDPATNTISLTLSGSGTDTDHDSLTYSWGEGSTPIGTSQGVSVSKTPGTYTFTLTVTDTYGASSTDDVTVTVQPEPNAAPSANAGPDQNVPVPHDGNPSTNTISLTLSGSGTDADHDDLTYSWNEGSTPIGMTQSVTVSKTPGIYTFTLTVTDSYGATSSDDVTVTVQPEPNSAPTASLASTKTITVPHDGNPATNTAQTAVTASASDSNGDPLAFAWRDAGNNVVSTTTTLDIPLTVGTYAFTFSATDPYGASISKSIVITVNPETNSAPTITLATSKTVAIPHDGSPATNTAQSNVTATVSDPNSDPVTVTWRDAANNVVGNATTLDIPLVAGTYVFTVTAVDSYGASTSKSITVTVTPEPNLGPSVTGVSPQAVTVDHDGNPATNAKIVFMSAVGSDPEHDSLTYEWKDETGAVIGTTASISASFTVGHHSVVVRVFDPYGVFGRTGNVSIDVLAELNGAPAAIVGPDQTVDVAHDGDPATNTAAVTLSSSSTDPDNDPLVYQWTDENSAVVGSTQTLTTTLTVGVHGFTLRVTDPYGATSFATTHVQVNAEVNTPPNLTMGPGPTVEIPHDGNPNTNTAMGTLTANAVDGQGDAITYQWSDGSQVIGTASSVTVTRTAGTYSYSLTVKDSYGATNVGSITFTVLPEPNGNPTSIVGPDHTLTTSPGDTTVAVSLDGSTSTDGDHDALHYSWSDGQNVIGTTPTLSLVKGAGTYAFTLTVTDPYGASSSATVNIIVKLGNRPPVAIVGPDVTVTVQHDGNPNTNMAAVTLDGSASNDPDPGQALTYVWVDQNSVPAGSSTQITVSLMPGTYSYALTVTDPFGATSTKTVHVTVLAEPNGAPLVSGGPDMSGVADASGHATFMISASASDPDNDTLTIKWFEGATEIGTGATLNATLSAGSHTLTVTATDPYGASTSDTVVVSVQYSGTFFLQPINNDGSSIFKQGSTVPVKFSLDGVSAGVNVTAYLYFAKITNSIVGTEMEAVSTSQADTGNQFRSGGGSQWIFNLNTKNLTAGTYQIRADLGDGALHTVIISLKP
jgi:hypothetical protein